MTEDQLRQFAAYGCMSRCLIKIAAALKKPISPDDFCAKYAALFPKGQLGGLATSDACHIAIDLGLCEKVWAVRDTGTIIEALHADQPSLVLTDVRLDGAWHRGGSLFHSRLLLAADSSPSLSSPLLRLWNPKPDLTEEVVDMPLSLLEVQMVHYLLLSHPPEPNQSLEPTPTSGTSAAEQPLVPSAVVAHL